MAGRSSMMQLTASSVQELHARSEQSQVRRVTDVVTGLEQCVPIGLRDAPDSMCTNPACSSSVVIFRTTPAEWDNPHPCKPDPEELENTFNLLNCLWFSIGSLMTQGSDILPK